LFSRFGLRQFPAEPSRRHPRQQQLLLQQQQQHFQQQQQLLQQQQQQNQRRFAKSFSELLGGGDIDDVNCMETLDRKISPTDEELVRTLLKSSVATSNFHDTFCDMLFVTLFLY